MNSYQVQAIFPQAFSSETLKLDVNKISKFCYDLKDKPKVKTEISNRGGWQSDDIDIKSIKNSEFVKLLDEIRIGINKVSSYIGIIPKLDINNIWININQYGNYNVPHVHHGSILSGTFYVKTPENCGKIEFENPIDCLMGSYLQYWHFKKGETYDSPWLSPTLEFTCEENKLIIFPSWLKHGVATNLNANEDRISIAFNTKVVRN